MNDDGTLGDMPDTKYLAELRDDPMKWLTIDSTEVALVCMPTEAFEPEHGLGPKGSGHTGICCSCHSEIWIGDALMTKVARDYPADAKHFPMCIFCYMRGLDIVMRYVMKAASIEDSACPACGTTEDHELRCPVPPLMDSLRTIGNLIKTIRAKSN